jgi:uncharacterized membrane protein HdeD (DUF308 family)
MPLHYFAQWWVWMLRGVVGIAFGLLAIFLPGLTLALLILFFGIWAVVDGITHLTLALRAAPVHSWLFGLEGLIGLGTGLIAFFYPMATALALVYVIAVWALMTGMARVALSFLLRNTSSRDWMIGLSGVLASLFGLLLAWEPEAGALALTIWIGVYAILAGLLLVGLALRMRRVHYLYSQEL